MTAPLDLDALTRLARLHTMAGRLAAATGLEWLIEEVKALRAENERLRLAEKVAECSMDQDADAFYAALRAYNAAKEGKR